MDEPNVEQLVGAGGVESGALKAGAVIHIEQDKATEDEQDPAKAEPQRREVLVQVVTALRNIAAKMVDEDEQKCLSSPVVVPHPDVRSVVEVSDDQLEGRGGQDLSVGLLAQPVEPPA